MERRSCVSFYVLLIFLLAGCNIEGRITSYDGNPMAGVKVTLSGSASLTTRTDSDGYYLFANMNPGRYTVAPVLDGLRSYPQSQQVSIERDDVFGIDFETEPSNHIRVPRDYDTLQDAVNAARRGDIIWLADGTYSGFGNYDISIDKVITIKSENGPKNCTVDCQEKGRGFLLSADATLSGIAIINGSHVKGGAILSDEEASPNIFNCIIEGNDALEAGGGIYTSGGQPRIFDCTISGNKAEEEGGGLFLGAGGPVVSGCTISNNIARKGGAISSIAATTLTQSIIRDNQAHEVGGGLYAHDGSQEIDHVRFYGNTAETTGAGIYINLGSSNIRHSTLADNQAANGGGFYAASGSHAFSHCILWRNAVDQIGTDAHTALSLSHSIVGQDNMEGDCVINEDPIFAGDRNYHLLEHSPCLDQQ